MRRRRQARFLAVALQLAMARHPRRGVPNDKLANQPMLELLPP
jgi:hypothetical protein